MRASTQTYLEHLRERYAQDQISLAQFDALVEEAIRFNYTEVPAGVIWEAEVLKTIQ